MFSAYKIPKNKIAAEAVVQRYSEKKVFLKISQNLQENSCARVSFLIKLQANFYSPWNHQKTGSFLMNSRRIQVGLQLY